MPLDWILLIVLAAIIVGVVTVAVVYGLHLLVRAIRKDRREEVAYEDEMAPLVADQQTAAGRVAVPQPVHPRTAARIEQVRQESPSAEVYELTEREWADHIAAHPLDGRSFDCFPDCDCMPAARNRPPFGIARYVPQQRDGGDL